MADLSRRDVDLTELARASLERDRVAREWRQGRDEAIRACYASGMTYEAIGEAVGLTKERIRQICDLRGTNPVVDEVYEGSCECGFFTTDPAAFDAHAVCNDLSKDRGTK